MRKKGKAKWRCSKEQGEKEDKNRKDGSGWVGRVRAATSLIQDGCRRKGNNKADHGGAALLKAVRLVLVGLGLGRG